MTNLGVHIRKSLISITALALVFSFLSPLGAFAVSEEELMEEIEEKNEELEKVQAEINKTQSSLTATSAYAGTLQKQIGTIDKSINQVQLNIRSSELTIDKLSLQIASLEETVAEQERELAEKRESIGETLRQMQEKDNENLLIVFLKSESLADGLAKSQGIVDLSDGLLVAVSDIERIKGELTQQLWEVGNKKNSKEQESQTLKAKRAIIEDQKKERQTLLTQTKSQETAYKVLLTKLEEEQRAISAEIDEIEAKLRGEFDQSLIPTPGAGELGYPLATLRVTQGYGSVPGACRLYKSCFHNGVDYAASIGTPILAAEDGEVIVTGDNGRIQYGKHILIKHGNNLTTLYAHLSRFAVSKGAQVKRGEVIGYAGNSGYAFGPHLHFMVYQASTVTLKPFAGAGLVPVGVTIDPRNYL